MGIGIIIVILYVLFIGGIVLVLSLDPEIFGLKKGEIHSLKSALANEKQLKSKKEAEIGNLQKSLSEIQNGQGIAPELFQEKEAIILQLEEASAEAKTEISRLQTELISKQDHDTSKDNEFQQLQEQLNQQQSKEQSLMAELDQAKQQQASVNTAEVEQMKKEALDAKTELARLQADLTTKHNEDQTRNTEIKKLHEQIQYLQDKEQSLLQQMDQLKQVSEKNPQATELEATLKEKENQLSETNTALQKAQSEQENLSLTIKNQTDQISEKETELVSAREHLAELQNDLKNSNAGDQESLNKFESEITEFEKILDGEDKTFQQIKGSLATNKAKIEQLDAKAKENLDLLRQLNQSS